jgi:hypothetical protein
MGNNLHDPLQSASLPANADELARFRDVVIPVFGSVVTMAPSEYVTDGAVERQLALQTEFKSTVPAQSQMPNVTENVPERPWHCVEQVV